jgi:hypothetical protein
LPCSSPIDVIVPTLPLVNRPPLLSPVAVAGELHK